MKDITHGWVSGKKGEKGLARGEVKGGCRRKQEVMMRNSVDRLEGATKMGVAHETDTGSHFPR